VKRRSLIPERAERGFPLLGSSIWGLYPSLVSQEHFPVRFLPRTPRDRLQGSVQDASTDLNQHFLSETPRCTCTFRRGSYVALHLHRPIPFVAPDRSLLRKRDLKRLYPFARSRPFFLPRVDRSLERAVPSLMLFLKGREASPGPFFASDLHGFSPPSPAVIRSLKAHGFSPSSEVPPQDHGPFFLF